MKLEKLKRIANNGLKKTYYLSFFRLKEGILEGLDCPDIYHREKGFDSPEEAESWAIAFAGKTKGIFVDFSIREITEYGKDFLYKELFSNRE